MRLLPCLLVLFLAGCADPATRCERSVARELRTIDTLIARTRADLARGYTYEYEPTRIRTGLTFCSGGSNVRLCTGNYFGPRRRPEAVDPEAERRKLAQLEARREALLTRGTALCRPAS